MKIQIWLGMEIWCDLEKGHFQSESSSNLLSKWVFWRVNASTNEALMLFFWGRIIVHLPVAASNLDNYLESYQEETQIILHVS